VAIALVVLGAALLLIPGLGETGLWTLGELPVLDRVLAALGEPRAELVRSPYLPDKLRLWAYVALGPSDAALRTPGAAACVGLVALTLVCARRLRWPPIYVALAGCFALALPLLLAQGRTALGNPIGELCVGAASLAIIAALERAPGRKLAARIGLGLLGLASLAGAIASLGVVLGGCLPLALVALADVARGPRHGGFDLPRWAVYAAWAGSVAAGFVGLWLAWHQGEGYIPLLGVAKELELIEDPTKLSFTASLEQLGYQLAPVTGLVVLGLLGPGRARWAALWLGVAVVLATAWSLAYGPTTCPVTVPAALLAAAACERMLDPDEPIAARRMILFCAVLAALVLAKDAGRTPQRIASPVLELSKIEFPTSEGVDTLDLPGALASMIARFAAVLVLAHLVAPPSRAQLRERERLAAPAQTAEAEAEREPWWRRPWSTVLDTLARAQLAVDRRLARFAKPRALAAAAIVLLGLAHLAWTYGRGVLGVLGEQMSIAAPLRVYEAAIDRGELADDRVALHRVRDPGVAHYGPGSARELFLASRAELSEYLSANEPRAVLIRRSDFPAVFKAARRDARPIYVLDASHHAYLIVANDLPPGAVDHSPVRDIVYDEPVTLAHETYVEWKPYVELLAWEIEGEVHRGATVTMHMVFRVRRSLPAGTKLYARLQKGKTSRVAATPHELTGGILPPNFWLPGDYIHHALEIEVPWLEVLPGEHELIVGLRRSEKTNLKISSPTREEPGPHGVEIRGKKSEFAVIGAVELLW